QDLPRPAGLPRPQAAVRRVYAGPPVPQERRNATRRALLGVTGPGVKGTLMNTLLDRFCRYVRIDTQADEAAGTYPSSPGQLELGRLLVQELRALGIADA